VFGCFDCIYWKINHMLQVKLESFTDSHSHNIIIIKGQFLAWSQAISEVNNIVVRIHYFCVSSLSGPSYAMYFMSLFPHVIPIVHQWSTLEKSTLICNQLFPKIQLSCHKHSENPTIIHIKIIWSLWALMIKCKQVDFVLREKKYHQFSISLVKLIIDL
jgi:hypothetical protein